MDNNTDQNSKKIDKAEPSHSHRIEKSAVITFIAVILLFFSSILVVMIAPSFIEKSWVSPTSPYQVQMYEIEDPNVYISSFTFGGGGSALQYVHHVKEGFTLSTFKESDVERIITKPELEKYVTRYKEPTLKLTSRILFLREPKGEFKDKADNYRKQLQDAWEKENPGWREKNLVKLSYRILELYDPDVKEAFSLDPSQGLLQNWVDDNFQLIDEKTFPYHSDYGVVYVQNPHEYRISPITINNMQAWSYDPEGMPVKNLEQLKKLGMDFRSRQELIKLGEHIYAIEGCWYCHTDQTRTLVQDTVLNGSDSFPAPPSSPNEYIYQRITFAGTRRIGPDMSRVGVKRPSRDWHKGHFWSPKTASAGSIMPSFRHFFDTDPRGTVKTVGIPNYRFEAIFQYLMTKGTRITPPTQAWWLGKDPINTIEIIEGKKQLR